MESQSQNPFQNVNNKMLLSAVSDVDRVAFYKKTYAHVAGGVLAFILFEYLLLQSDAIVNFTMSMTQGYRWLIMLGGFMFITNYAEKMALKSGDRNKQYLAFGLYILAEAFIFVPLIYIAAFYMESGPEILNQAAIVTLALFTGLSAVVFLTKKRFLIPQNRIDHWLFYSHRTNHCRNVVWVQSWALVFCRHVLIGRRVYFISNL
jgi:FtsH-binding integral membrane protein